MYFLTITKGLFWLWKITLVDRLTMKNNHCHSFATVILVAVQWSPLVVKRTHSFWVSLVSFIKKMQAVIWLCSPQNVCCAEALACALRICFSRIFSSSSEMPIFFFVSNPESTVRKRMDFRGFGTDSCNDSCGLWAAWEMAVTHSQREAELVWNKAGLGSAQLKEMVASFCWKAIAEKHSLWEVNENPRVATLLR